MTESTKHWKQDFPVSCDDDSYATRREFMKFLGLTSMAFFVGTCAAAGRRLWARFSAAQTQSVAVAGLNEIPVGGHKLFRYPTEAVPCILLRLAPDKFVAFEQRCTHLSCPVYFSAASSQLVCPCHHGFFNAEDGRPLAGPPKRALNRLAISVDGERVWARSLEERNA